MLHTGSLGFYKYVGVESGSGVHHQKGKCFSYQPSFFLLFKPVVFLLQQNAFHEQRRLYTKITSSIFHNIFGTYSTKFGHTVSFSSFSLF